MTQSLRFWSMFVCGILACVSGNADEVRWPGESIFYHVYVRSFADSDGDGKGDLPGLTEKLEYIESLGVDGLLLLPIFQNDHHEYGGYATTDFAHVDKEYGGDAAWNTFIAEARRRKLKVVLDLSISHVADTHPWFVAAKKDPKAPERAHFIWAGPPCPTAKGVFGTPAWNALGDGRCYFALYAPTVPQLNFRNKATAEAMIAVGASWLNRGADGFRLDSAPHIAPIDPDEPEVIGKSTDLTHAFWRSFMAEMKRVKPSSLAVAEVMDGDPKSLAPYYADGISMVFDYPTYFGLVDAFSTGKKVNLEFLVSAGVAARPRGAMGGIFLGNHDVPGEFIPPHGRMPDLLGGNITRMQSAALLLFSLPSTPFVYYGDEIGLRGGLPPARDEDPASGPKKAWSRNPMQWNDSPRRGFSAGKPWVPFSTDTASVAAQDGVAGTMLETYRGLIKVRRASPALTRGKYRDVPNDHPAVFSFLREEGQQRILVAVNLSAEQATATFDMRKLGFPRATVTEHIFGLPLAEITPANAHRYSLELPAYEGRWLSIK